MSLLSHPDNLVPVDGILRPQFDGCVFDKAPELVSGHPQLDTVVVGIEAHSHSVPVDFQLVEPVNPYRSAGVGHSIATSRSCLSTRRSLAILNKAPKRSVLGVFS